MSTPLFFEQVGMCPNKHQSVVPSSESKDAYLKEKKAFNGYPKGLDSWLEDLCILAQTTKVANDVKLTQGSKVGKFMA